MYTIYIVYTYSQIIYIVYIYSIYIYIVVYIYILMYTVYVVYRFTGLKSPAILLWDILGLYNSCPYKNEHSVTFQ